MLEHVTDLHECERMLSASINNIRFLGEVDFSLADIEHLSTLIKEGMDGGGERGIRLLRSVPCCLSLYLVGKGSVSYCGGEFWTPVIEDLGLVDDRSRHLAGKIFLKLVQSRSLSCIQIKGALPYVAPILLHGGLPMSCFKEFYETIVIYLLEQKVVEEDDIDREICRLRANEQARNELLNHRKSCLDKIDALKLDVAHLESIISLFMIKGQSTPGSLGASGEAYAGRLRALRSACLAQQRRQRKLAGLKQGMAEWESALEQVAATLSLPARWAPDQKIMELIASLAQSIDRRDEAEAAQTALDQEVLPGLLASESRRAQLGQETAAVEEGLAELGGGSLAAGIRLLKEKRSVLDRMREIEKALAQGVNFQSPVSPEQALGLKQELGQEIADLRRYGDALPWRRDTLNRMGQEIEDLQGYIYLIEELARLMAMTTDPKSWADLPDYGRFIAAKNAEIDKIEQETARLRAREAECRRRIRWYSPNDQKYVDLTAKIMRLAQDSAFHRAQQDRYLTLDREAEEGAREIAALASQLCPPEQRMNGAEAAGVEGDIQGFIAGVALYDNLDERIEQATSGTGAAEDASSLLKTEDAEKEHWLYVAALAGAPEDLQGAVLVKDEKSRELQAAQADLFQVEEQLARYVSPIDYTDEPVQRFVIYGERWAVKWLYACTALHRHYLGEAIDLVPVAASLPARVIARLDEILRTVIDNGEKRMESGPERLRGVSAEREQEQPPENKLEKNIDSGSRMVHEHFTRPQLRLDPGRGALRLALGGHRFHVYDASIHPDLYVKVVSGEAPPVWTKEVKLSGYLKNGIVEIPEVEIDLPHISGTYLVTQFIGKISRPWRITLWNTGPYLIFDEKGRRLDSIRLGAQRAWLLYPEDHELYPGNAIVSVSEAVLGVNGYRMALVNLALEPVISLIDNNGQVYEIAPVAAAAPAGPFLTGEEITVGAWVDGKRPIYAGKVPKLCVPCSDEAEMGDWEIRVSNLPAGAKEETIVTGRQIPLAGYSSDKKYMEIDLDSGVLLGRQPFGEYTVVLARRHMVECRFDLAIFPGLMIFFESGLYFPRLAGSGAEDKEAVITIVRPEQIGHALQVEVEKPARTIADDNDENDETHIAVDLDEDELQIKLHYPSGSGRYCSSITVEIPKIAWRIKGSKTPELEQWSQHLQEVWHEDCYGGGALRLEVALPGTSRYAAERSSVYLEGTGHRLATRDRGRLLTFDLSGLADTLSSGRETYSLWLAIEDPGGKSRISGKLFDIRRQWRVEQIRYTWDDESRILGLCWVDRGRAHDRVALLWRLWEPWLEPQSFAITDGVSELKISGSARELPPGPYLLKFDVSDQWSDEQCQLAVPVEEINTVSLFIPGAGTRVAVSECRWLDGRILQISGSVSDAAGGAGRKEIAISLYGVTCGAYKNMSVATVTDHNGQFTLKFDNPYTQASLISNGTLDRKKSVGRPHWLGVTVKGGDPAYHFQVLPEPGVLMWPLSLGAALTGKEVAAGGRVYIDCQDVNLDEPCISQGLSRAILLAYRQGDEIEQNISISVGGTDKRARLFKGRQSDDVVIELETEAVKCLDKKCPYGYGTIEPDQQAWNTRHYPRCKSFRYNFRQIKAKLHWRLDVQELLADLQRRYLLAGPNVLLLYSSTIRPLPDGVGPDAPRYDEAEQEILITALWEQEMILLGGGMRH